MLLCYIAAVVTSFIRYLMSVQSVLTPNICWPALHVLIPFGSLSAKYRNEIKRFTIDYAMCDTWN